MSETRRELADQPGVGTRQTFLAALASALGWALDLYDLILILYVAPAVGRAFFPTTRPTLSLAAVYATFAVTLLMRPVGSAIFGSYADRHGRKVTLYRTIVGVGIVTALLGALPTIDQVGLLAPALFTILRLAQGIFVGGVMVCTGTIGVETVPERWRGLMSGLIGGGAGGIGGLIASGVFWIVSSAFPGDLFLVWGWRCMFFSGIMSSILGIVLVRRLEESPLWTRLQAGRAARSGPARAPLRRLFSRQHRGVFLVNLLLTTGGGAGYYLTTGFLPTLLKVVNGLDSAVASAILVGAATASFVAAVTTGHLSQIFGRKRMFVVLGLLRLVILPGFCLLMARSADPGNVAAYGIVLCFLGSASYAPLLVFLNERFPTAVRASGVGLSWNIGFSIGGALPALVSFVAPSTADLPSVLAATLLATAVLYLAGAVIVPETRGRMA